MNVRAGDWARRSEDAERQCCVYADYTGVCKPCVSAHEKKMCAATAQNVMYDELSMQNDKDYFCSDQFSYLRSRRAKLPSRRIISSVAFMRSIMASGTVVLQAR